MQTWAEIELAPWRHLVVEGRHFESNLRKLAEENDTIYLFEIDGSEVRFDNKGLSQRAGDPDFSYRSALVSRGHVYRAFFASVLQAFGLKGRALLALDLTDLRAVRSELPVFAFQRRRYEAVPLVPDVEMIEHDFFIKERFCDDVPFIEKRCEAAFTGATTGDPVLTRHLVEKKLNARIRAAVFFKDEPDVVFDLPKVVQCDTAETAGLVESLGISGTEKSWKEQLASRYLISLDGNGAACSRPYLALASNSVLLKYNSPHELFYFKGLRPWLEFIPVREDEDVIRVLKSSGSAGEQHADIASRSKKFVDNNLSRIHVMHYMRDLLSMYMDQFGSVEHGAPSGMLDRQFAIDLYVRTLASGTVWSAPMGWGGDGVSAIDGFALVPDRSVSPQDLSYKTIDGEGRINETAASHQLCGRAGTAIHGLCVNLEGSSGGSFDLRYQARFADNFESEIVVAGTKLWRKEAPITGIQLIVRPR